MQTNTESVERESGGTQPGLYGSERHRERERGGTQRAWNRRAVVLSQGLTDLNGTGC